MEVVANHINFCIFTLTYKLTKGQVEFDFVVSKFDVCLVYCKKIFNFLNGLLSQQDRKKDT